MKFADLPTVSFRNIIGKELAAPCIPQLREMVAQALEPRLWGTCELSERSCISSKWLHLPGTRTEITRTQSVLWDTYLGESL